MLKQIIDAARLKPESCASLVRVPLEHFREWLDGKRPIPRYVIPELVAVLGVSEKELLSKAADRSRDSADVAPAVWFKLRNERLTDADRDFVGLVRQLGYFMAQLATIRNSRLSVKWRSFSGSVLGGIDRSAPPASQGREAALRFREALDFEHGQTGIGELLRGRLRQLGLMVIESPIPRSELEGCCFEIGRDESSVPCVFANTFRSTWFRRNEIILHEVCHAIFDIETDPVALDFRDESEPVGQIAESRARAFAQHCMIPKRVLVHYANQMGIEWGALTAEKLAQLVAAIHVEQRTILRSAQEADFITEEQSIQYLTLDCAEPLRQFSSHALSTHDYIQSLGADEEPKWLSKNRTTTRGPRPLLLPAGYVAQVIKAFTDGEISQGKAAEMLMVDEATLLDRFEEILVVADVP